MSTLCELETRLPLARTSLLATMQPLAAQTQPKPGVQRVVKVGFTHPTSKRRRLARQTHATWRRSHATTPSAPPSSCLRWPACSASAPGQEEAASSSGPDPGGRNIVVAVDSSEVGDASMCVLHFVAEVDDKHAGSPCCSFMRVSMH
jgi:hypothetical protein